MRVLHHDEPALDLAAAADAAARSGFPAVSLVEVGKRYGEGPSAVDALAGADLKVWLAGTALGRWFMANCETEGYRWSLRMQPATYIVVVLRVFAAAVVAQLPVWRRLRHLDIARIVRKRAL